MPLPRPLRSKYTRPTVRKGIESGFTQARQAFQNLPDPVRELTGAAADALAGGSFRQTDPQEAGVARSNEGMRELQSTIRTDGLASQEAQSGGVGGAVLSQDLLPPEQKQPAPSTQGAPTSGLSRFIQPVRQAVEQWPGFEKARQWGQITRNVQEYGPQLQELREIYNQWAPALPETQESSLTQFVVDDDGQLDPSRIEWAATELLPSLRENLPSPEELSALGLTPEKAMRTMESLGIDPAEFSTSNPEETKKDLEFAGQVFDSFLEGLDIKTETYQTPEGPQEMTMIEDSLGLRQTRRLLNRLSSREGQKELSELLRGAGEATGQQPLQVLKSWYMDDEGRFQSDKFEEDVPKLAGALGNAWNLMDHVGRVFSPEQLQEMGLTPKEFMQSHMRKEGRPDWESMNRTVQFWDRALRVFDQASPEFKDDFVNVMQLGDRLRGIGLLGKGSDIIGEVGKWFFDEKGNMTHPTLFRALVKVGSFAEESWEALMEEKDPGAWLKVLAGGLGALALIKHFITPSAPPQQQAGAPQAVPVSQTGYSFAREPSRRRFSLPAGTPEQPRVPIMTGEEWAQYLQAPGFRPTPQQ